MKKVLLILLAFTLIFAIAGCNNGSTSKGYPKGFPKFDDAPPAKKPSGGGDEDPIIFKLTDWLKDHTSLAAPITAGGGSTVTVSTTGLAVTNRSGGNYKGIDIPINKAPINIDPAKGDYKITVKGTAAKSGMAMQVGGGDKPYTEIKSIPATTADGAAFTVEGTIPKDFLTLPDNQNGGIIRIQTTDGEHKTNKSTEPFGDFTVTEIIIEKVVAGGGGDWWADAVGLGDLEVFDNGNTGTAPITIETGNILKVVVGGTLDGGFRIKLPSGTSATDKVKIKFLVKQEAGMTGNVKFITKGNTGWSNPLSSGGLYPQFTVGEAGYELEIDFNNWTSSTTLTDTITAGKIGFQTNAGDGDYKCLIKVISIDKL